MEREVKILTENECFKKGNALKPVRLVLHSVGCEQPNRLVFVNSWNTLRPNGRQVCVHGFIDDDGYTQTLPYDMRAWGCGSGVKGSFNADGLHIELCEPRRSDSVDMQKNYFLKTYNNAVELFAELCEKLDIKPDKIYSHKEAYSLGYASNHGDPDHWWGQYNKTMHDFRTDVNKKIASNMSELYKCSTPKISTIKIALNGDVRDVESINVGGLNFVKLRDLECGRLVVGYDTTKGMPSVTIR